MQEDSVALTAAVLCDHVLFKKHKDTAGKDIPAIKGFMNEHREGVPGASAELRQKLSVMQEVQPEHLRNTPHPMWNTNSG